MNALPNFPDFTAHLHEQFLVPLDDHTAYPLELLEVTPLAPSRSTAGRADPFALKFRGPGPGYLPQQIHHMHNANMGEIYLFLVPLGMEKGSFIYQAIFN